MSHNGKAAQTYQSTTTKVQTCEKKKKKKRHHENVRKKNVKEGHVLTGMFPPT